MQMPRTVLTKPTQAGQGEERGYVALCECRGEEGTIKPEGDAVVQSLLQPEVLSCCLPGAPRPAAEGSGVGPRGLPTSHPPAPAGCLKSKP